MAALYNDQPDVLAWFRTRVLVRRVLLACAVVTVASVLASPRALGLDLLGTILLAVLFVVQFRLWDDLMHVAHDRQQYPDRVLARAPDLRDFQGTLVASIVMLFALMFVANPVRGFGYALLLVAFALIHRRFSRHRPDRTVRGLVVNLKYPAFVLLLADWPLEVEAYAIAAGLYGLLCIQDWRDTRA
jgi:hypothetical protein